MRLRRVSAVAVLCLLPGGAGFASEPPSFKATVAPVLVDHCIACHNAKKAEGGYRLDTFGMLTSAGDSGEATVVAGPQPGGELLRRITSGDPDERMPPDAPPLPPTAIAAVRAWLVAGAAFDGAKPSDLLTTVMPPRSHTSPSAYSQGVPVTAIAFSPDGSRLFVGGYHEVLVFDAADGKLLRRLGNVGQRVMAIRFLADGRTIAVAGGEPGREGDVRLLDSETGGLKHVCARSTDMVLDVAPRPGSDQLAVAGTDGILRLIDTSNGDEVRAISSHGDWVTAVAWSDDGRRLASASRDTTVKVFDAEAGELISTFSGHTAPVRGVALSPDGTQGFSAAGGDDKTLRHWNADNGASLGKAVPLSGEGLRVTRDGGRVFVANGGKTIAAVDTATGAIVTFVHPDWPLSIAVHPGIGLLASGSIDGEVRLFKLSDGAFIKAWTARP